jgi:hypothetical protein
MALLGLLGSQGWELVSFQIARVPGVLSESDVTACYFKRPVMGKRLRCEPRMPRASR